MENASSASLKKMEIDTSSSAKSSSSMDCSPAGSKCSSAKSLMDEDITPEKTTTTTVLTPMDCSYKASSSVASSPSINSPIAASAGSDSSILPPKKKKKAELTWELNEDGVKVYTLRCGCGDIQRLMASEGNILRITNL
ncbi:hypothetical protein Bca4012_038789 [Brassica carinata]|uniref:Uncharacterized protein n=1 Tax=Brassica carinata TaxID=52824 RepID=A0A8X8B7G4_BRACI|nr:hypothetical protein Bca52824_007006 [Brassica carinata]